MSNQPKFPPPSPPTINATEGEVGVENLATTHKDPTSRWWKHPAVMFSVGVILTSVTLMGVFSAAQSRDNEMVQGVTQEVSELQNQVIERDTTIEALQADLAEATSKINSENDLLRETQEAVATSEDQLTKLQKDSDSSKKKLEGDLKAANDALTETKSKLTATETSLKTAQEQISLWEKTAKALSQQITEAGGVPVPLPDSPPTDD